MTAPRPMIVQAVKAFKADSSPALFWQIYDDCESDEERAFVRSEVAPAMTFRWPKKRGRKRGSTDGAFTALAFAVRDVHDMVAASDGKLSKAAAIRAVSKRKGIQQRQLRRAVYGDHAAVSRLMSPGNSPPNFPDSTF